MDDLLGWGVGCGRIWTSLQRLIIFCWIGAVISDAWSKCFWQHQCPWSSAERHWNFTLMFIGSFAQHLSTNIVLRHNLFINSSLLRVAQALFERAIMSVWFMNASATGPQTWSFILSNHPCLGGLFFEPDPCHHFLSVPVCRKLMPPISYREIHVFPGPKPSFKCQIACRGCEK